MVVRTTAIISAMPQEAALIRSAMQNHKIYRIGNRDFVQGTFQGSPVVFCVAGIGKVSAAATTAILISQFQPHEVLFTGVAGGGEKTSIGDIVVGSSYLQHDLDLRPIFPQFYIYSLGEQVVCASEEIVAKIYAAANRFLQRGVAFPELGIAQPQVHAGAIVSGDQFVNHAVKHEQIMEDAKEVLLDGFLAIEMEGAAVAQVCQEMNVPFVVVRSISDKANSDAKVDFPVFLDQVAGTYSLGILEEYFKSAVKD